MVILVVEDEIKTAKALIKILSDIRPNSRIDGPLQKVSSTVEYLTSHPAPDLIFMDIQLADGLSFSIFQQIEVTSPVIFCTAFDEYALDAFKANGIDYILKPFFKETIQDAFIKFDRMTQTLTNNILSSVLVSRLLGANQQKKFKQSFLVFQNGKYKTIAITDTAYFFVKFEQTRLVTFSQEIFVIDQSLEETAAQVDPDCFFKLNRQYLISIKAIKEVEHYFARKLLIKLIIPTEEKLLVGKDKTSVFLQWLGDR